MRITVVGAAPGGLAAALAAQQRGFEVEVLEARSGFDSPPGAWLLNANGIRVLQLLEVTAPAVPVAGLNLAGVGHLAHPCCVVARQGLLQKLAESLPIRFGNAVSQLPDGIVIGADGADSSVRRLAGLRARMSPRGTYGLSVKRGPAEPPREVWGADGSRTGYDPLPDGGVAVFTRPAPLGTVLKQAWRVDAPRWHSGSVFLIGDAAHAQAPTLGQGANSAMVDGYLLIQLLTSLPLERVGPEYERVRRGFVQRTQLLADAVHWLSSHPFPGRNACLRLGSKLGLPRLFSSYLEGRNPQRLAGSSRGLKET